MRKSVNRKLSELQNLPEVRSSSRRQVYEMSVGFICTEAAVSFMRGFSRWQYCASWKENTGFQYGQYKMQTADCRLGIKQGHPTDRFGKLFVGKALRWLTTVFPRLKPRPHERFFARAGDAIFSNFVASPARDENRTCGHPRTGDATGEEIARKKSPELKFSRQNRRDSARVATLQLSLVIRNSSGNAGISTTEISVSS